MSATVRKVLPKVLRDHINSPHTCGLEIGLLCYPANLQHGAENSSGVKSVLWLPLLCFGKKKNLYVFWAPPISYLLQNRSKERKTGHRQRTATSYRFPLPASSNYSWKKNCFSQMVLMGCQLSKCVC